MAVTIGPGATTLQVTLRGASSRATERVSPKQPRLRGRVVRLAGAAAMGADRGDVDDAAPPRPHHLRARRVGSCGTRR